MRAPASAAGRSSTGPTAFAPGPGCGSSGRREHGLEGVDGPDFDRHLDAIFERLSVNDRCSDLNGPQQRMKEGADQLGWSLQTILRNTDESCYDPASAAYIGFGDQSGSKQSTQRTYLQDAFDAGADIVVRCTVERVLVENGQAAGRRGHVGRSGDRPHRSRDRARAAGRGRGRLARVAGAAAALADRGPGGRELPAHPSLHRALRDVRRGPGGLVGSAAGRARGRVRSGRGRLRLPGRDDAVRAGAGRVRAAVHRRPPAQGDDGEASATAAPSSACCATTATAASRSTRTARPSPTTTSPTSSTCATRTARSTRRRGCTRRPARARSSRWPPARTRWRDGRRPRRLHRALAARARCGPAASGSSARTRWAPAGWATTPQTSVADPWGELHDTKGVWIGDGSAFPTSSGTNPMISIMALAHRTAEAIAADRSGTTAQGRSRRQLANFDR